jgi:transposase
VTVESARIAELEARLAALEAERAQVVAERDRAAHERDEYRKMYELVMLELDRVKRHLRAQNKSERVDAAQIQLAFSELGIANVPADLAARLAAEENAERGSTRDGDADRGDGKKRGHGRTKIPPTIERTREVVAVPEAERVCPCCGQPRRLIGYETSEKLDYRPACLICIETAREKWACPCEESGVVTAPVPDSPVERGFAGAGLLAHTVISKFEDHLPLHRLAGMLARHGVQIARSTLGDWVEQVADLLAPIVEAMAKDALRAHRIHTDDTGIPILDKGGTQRGHVWVYLADDDHAVFRYTRRRRGDGPREFLAGYTGFVQADAANLYDRLFPKAAAAATAPAAPISPSAIEVGCWAHTRRKFFDAKLTDEKRALIALGFIRELYAIDDACRALADDQRTAARRERAGPWLEQFKEWLDAEALTVIPKSPLAVAIGYARNQWGALTRFLDDGRLRLDNNPAERQLRRVAVGRKNWLFAGSETGAERACVLYSILASCRLHGVDPFAYLTDVLVRVHSHPAARVLDLCPKAWKQQLQHRDAAESIAAPAPAALG